jgi:hypothetical protein
VAIGAFAFAFAVSGGLEAANAGGPSISNVAVPAACPGGTSDIAITVDTTDGGWDSTNLTIDGVVTCHDHQPFGAGGGLQLVVITVTAPAISDIYPVTVQIYDDDNCTNLGDTDSSQSLHANQSPPTADAGVDQDVCAGDDVLLSGSATNVGLLTWTTSGDGSFLDASAASTTYTPGAGDVASGLVTLSLTNELTGCPTAAASIEVTLHAPPTADAGGDQTACDTDTVQLSGSTSNSTGCTWSTSGSGSFDDPTNLGAVYTPSPSDLSTGSVILTLTCDGDPSCPPAVDDMTVTFQVSPSVDAGTNFDICSNAAASLTGFASDVQSTIWTTSGDGTFDDDSSLTTNYNPGPNDTLAGIVTLTLEGQAIAPCAIAATDSIDVAITTAPTADAGPDQTICATDTATMAGSSTNSTSCQWSTSGDGSFDDTTAPAAVYTPGAGDLANGDVTLTYSCDGNTPCSPDADEMLLAFQAQSTADAGADQTVCAGQDVTLSGTVTNASIVTWSTSGDGDFANSSSADTSYTPGPNDIAAGTVDLQLTSEDILPCTSGAFDTLTVTILTAPTVDPGPDQTICESDTASISGSAANHISTLWTTSGDGTFDDNSALSAVYTPGTTDITNGVVTLTLSADGNAPCPPATSNLIVTIQPNPSVDAGPDQTACEGATVNLSATVLNAGTSTWTTSGDGMFDDANAANVFYSPGAADIAAGTVTLTITVDATAPCTGQATDDLVLTIVAATSADAGPDQTVCAGFDVTLAGSVADSTGNEWTTSGDGAFDDAFSLTAMYTPGPNDISNGAVTLTLTSTANAPCLNASDDMVVTIQGTPVADAGSDQTICAGQTAPLDGTNSSNVGTALWTTAGDGAFDDDSSLTAVYTPGPADILTGSVVLSLTIAAVAPCTGDDSDDVLITIAPGPTADAGGDQTICDTDTVTLAGTASNNNGITWTTTGDGNFDDDTSLTAVYTPGANDIINGTVTLTLNAHPNAPCVTDDTDDMVVTIQASPTADAGADQTVCESDPVALSGNATGASSFSWSTSGDGSFDDANISDPVYTPGPNDLLSGSVTLTFTVQPIAPCTGPDSDDMLVTFQTSPSADAGPDQTVCDTDTVTLAGSASDNNGVTWTTSGDGNFDDDSVMTPVYTPGTSDISAGTVTLTLAAHPIAPCAADDSDDVVVTIQNSPKADPDDDQTICDGDTVQLAGTTANSSGCTWTTGGDGAFDDHTSLTAIYIPGPGDIALGTVDLTLTCDPIAPCAVPTANFITITINPLPDSLLPVNASDTAVCSGDDTNVLVEHTVLGVEYQLVVGNQDVGTAKQGSGGTINLPTGPITTATTFAVRATNTATHCTSLLVDTINIGLNAETTINTPPDDVTAVVQLNSTATATFAVAATGTNLTYRWQQSTNGGTTFINAIGGSGATTDSYTTPTLVLTDDDKQYRCIVTGDCGAETSDVAILTVQDASGVSNEIEDAGPNGGDGNGDGIPDSQQPNVTSLPNSNGEYVTLVTPDGTELTSVVAGGNPSPGDTPAEAAFPMGFLSFNVNGLTPGGSTQVKIMVHGGVELNAYYKYGPEPTNPTPHWYEFTFDGETGALVEGNLITLGFVDGKRGDHDLTVNGSIMDPGGAANKTGGPAGQPLPGSNLLCFNPILSLVFRLPVCGLGCILTMFATLTGLIGMKLTRRRRY